MTSMHFDEPWLKDYEARTGKTVRDPLRDAVRGGKKNLRPATNEADKPVKRSKYGNKRTVVDGIEFDSQREAARYSELMLMLRAGEIYGVLRQHPFRLPGNVVYRADFVVLNKNGTYTVEDAKGMRTDVYKIKRRQMRECLGIEIVEV